MDALTDLLSLIASNVWLYGGAFVLVLSVLVVVHEWGHYAVARACGVRIEEFAVGFGPELFGMNDRRGTRWKVCLLPVGGYVKMFGDSDPASSSQTDQVEGADGAVRPMTEFERSQAFFAKKVWQRAAIVFAGPGINYLFAILLLAGLYVYQGREITPPVISAIQVGGAGEASGLLPGDRVLSVDGKSVQTFDELRRAVMLALDTPIALRLVRNGQEMALTAVPARISDTDRFGFTHERGFLGILGPTNGFDLSTVRAVNSETVADADAARKKILARLGQGPFRLALAGGDGEEDDQVLVNPASGLNGDLYDPQAPNYGALVPVQGEVKEYIEMGPFEATKEAVVQSYQITAESLFALWQMITGVRSATELGGVIRIGALAGDMAQTGLLALITFTALLSINLGMINLFPIPMLDGGHLVFYAAEAVRGSPVPEPVQDYAFKAGLAFLIVMMVFANVNDLVQMLL